MADLSRQAWMLGGTIPETRAIGVGEFFEYLQSQEQANAAVRTVADAYSAVAWVYRCANLRAQKVASVPWRVVDASGNEVQYELRDELAALLSRVEFALCLYGASYLLKLRNRYGQTGWQWLNPTTMKPKTDRERGIVGFEQRAHGRLLSFATEDVVYHTLFHPTNDVGPGVAPAAVALRAAGLGNNAVRYVEQFFANGAVTPVILTTDNPLPDTEIERVRDVWQRRFGGIGNFFRTVILRQGLRPMTIGSPLRDLVVQPLLSEARQQIAVAFGIPQTLLEDAANYATAREHRLSFYQETVFPECELIARELNRQHFGSLGLTFEFQFSRVEAVQQDEATKAASLVSLVSAGVMTVAEARDALGLDPQAMIAAPQSDDEDVDAQIEQLSEDAIKDLARWRRKVRRGDSSFESRHIPRWLQDAVRFRLADERFVTTALDPCTRAFSQNGAENRMKKRIAGIFSDAWNDIERDIERGEMPSESLEELKRALQSALMAELVATVADAILADAVEVGAPIDYADAVAAATDWSRDYAAGLARGLDDTTRASVELLVQQVKDGTLTGEDALALASRMFDEARAESIAVTETTSAMTAATEIYRDELEKRGIQTVERWLTAEDERVCPTCGALDHTLRDEWGKVVPDGPPAHPNCRCQIVLELAE